jgi:hypothetical protein
LTQEQAYGYVTCWTCNGQSVTNHEEEVICTVMGQPIHCFYECTYAWFDICCEESEGLGGMCNDLVAVNVLYGCELVSGDPFCSNCPPTEGATMEPCGWGCEYCANYDEDWVPH